MFSMGCVASTLPGQLLFLKKKKQKDFYDVGSENSVAALPQAQQTKSLLLLFFRKEGSYLVLNTQIRIRQIGMHAKMSGHVIGEFDGAFDVFGEVVAD